MKVIDTEKLPIKLWLDDIEDGALAQAKDLANHPFAVRWIAIMPDSHQGYGMPIGGVMATKEVIIPNAVGVDIGCLDLETEYLTKTGWRKINNYNNEEILVFDKDSEKAFFDYPVAYIKDSCEWFYHLKADNGLDQIISSDHKILFWSGVKNRGYTKIDYLASTFVKKHESLEKGLQGGIKATFDFYNSGINLTDDEIRLTTMLSADGCLRKETNGKRRWEIHLKKKRKIIRAKNLLDACNINFHTYNNKDDTVAICFYTDLKISKNLDIFWRANKQQLNVLAQESLLWDGSIDIIRKHSYYSSTNKNNADIIQFAFASNGIRCGISSLAPKNKWKMTYYVFLTNNEIVGVPPMKNVPIVTSKDGNKYCFTTKTGYFVARRGNNIFVTGNCGMSAVKTSLKEIDTDTIKLIMGEIRKVVPVGFNHQKEKQTWTGFDNAPDISIIQQELNSARNQLGTLGGGNHFIEIQKGNDGYIWVMLHSGSRNFGLKTATEYHKKAQTLCERWISDIPNKDLAFLPLDVTEGQEYLSAMNYCLDFAFANRALMMDRIMNIVSAITFGAEIVRVNIHHNYAIMEHHFGQNVLVHRKGATKASLGLQGIIPGSMGTHSYITEGLGNPDSFESSSHGAGRRMGRKEASRSLNLEEEQKKMSGIVNGLRTVKDLDEAPGAYKDIDVVMENQKDLVKMIVELTPLAGIKG